MANNWGESVISTRMLIIDVLLLFIDEIGMTVYVIMPS